jgi:uncharacterized protein with HEPN domain
MSDGRLHDYVAHMQSAASDACAFVEGMSQSHFLNDKRTQQAVVMSLFIVGEAASKIAEQHSTFAARHAHIPWQSMRGMRNRIAHGYFDINLLVVWETVQTALPTLLSQLKALPPTP